MNKPVFIISLLLNVILAAYIAWSAVHEKEKLEQAENAASMKTLRTVFTNYHKSKVSIFEVMPNDSNEIIFVGNSITDYCDWNELFSNPLIKNRGISADFIAGVTARLEEITESHPDKIFLMVGINDLQKKRPVNEVLDGYEKLLEKMIGETPASRIYIQSLLPENRDNLNTGDVMAVNEGLKALAEKYHLTYIDLFTLFKTDNNEMNMKYSLDGLHPNGHGYLLWKSAIEKYVNE